MPHRVKANKCYDCQENIVKDLKYSFSCRFLYFHDSLCSFHIEDLQYSIFLPQTVFRRPLGNHIGDHQKRTVDYGIKQSDCRGVAPVLLDQTNTLYIGRNNVCRVINRGVIQKDGLFIAHAHQRAHSQNQHNYNRRRDTWYCYVEGLFPLAGAVDGRRLIQLRVHSR